MGTPKGLFHYLLFHYRASLAWEWEETRCAYLVITTLPSRRLGGARAASSSWCRASPISTPTS